MVYDVVFIVQHYILYAGASDVAEAQLAGEGGGIDVGDDNEGEDVSLRWGRDGGWTSH